MIEASARRTTILDPDKFIITQCPQGAIMLIKSRQDSVSLASPPGWGLMHINITVLKLHLYKYLSRYFANWKPSERLM